MPDTGRDHGLDPAICLRGTGLTRPPSRIPTPRSPPSSTHRRHAHITLTQRGEVARLSMNDANIPRNLLAALGDEPRPRVWRPTCATAEILGFALLSCPTMCEAIIIGLRHIGLSSALVHLTLTERGRGSAPVDVREFLVERDIGAVIPRVSPMPSCAGTASPPAATAGATDRPRSGGTGAATASTRSRSSLAGREVLVAILGEAGVDLGRGEAEILEGVSVRGASRTGGAFRMQLCHRCFGLRAQ